MNASAQRLLRVGRNVADLDRAVAFYRDALGFGVQAGRDAGSAGQDRIKASQDPPYAGVAVAMGAAPLAWTRLPGVDAVPTRCARLSLGTQEIELTEFPDATPYPADSTSADLWFQHCAVVVDDMDAAYARLLRHGGATAISRDGPQRLPPSSGGVTAFKFRDPDGHPLELISFPPGSGDSVWQQQASGPTLGIDHSAISVADVERSIAFYELLGLRVASRGVNRGAEQQRLDDLANVEVDVIALQPAAAKTPHIELLCYRTPHGRELPETGVRDIAADRLVLQTQNLPALLDKLSGTYAGSVASGPTVSNDDSQTALLRDPDGHWLALSE